MSESEEMYLITIARLSERGIESPIPISLLAEELSVQPVSVNQMVRKLEESGLVRYTPYKGVALTRIGERQALSVLRLRRLWEVFLVEKLGLSADAADALACRMEHITTPDVADRLAAFLENPNANPMGRAIPDKNASSTIIPAVLLSQLNVGETAQITHIQADQSVLGFFNATGIIPSAKITLLGTDGTSQYFIQTPKTTVNLNKDLSEKIFLIKKLRLQQ